MGRGDPPRRRRLSLVGRQPDPVESPDMVTISFDNRATERKALAFLLGRFSGRVLKGGEHLLPAAAVEALAEQGIPFRVKGKGPRVGRTGSGDSGV